MLLIAMYVVRNLILAYLEDDVRAHQTLLNTYVDPMVTRKDAMAKIRRLLRRGHSRDLCEY